MEGIDTSNLTHKSNSITILAFPDLFNLSISKYSYEYISLYQKSKENRKCRNHIRKIKKQKTLELSSVKLVHKHVFI